MTTFVQLMLNIIPQFEVHALLSQALCMSRRNVQFQGLLQVTSRALYSLIFFLLSQGDEHRPVLPLVGQTAITTCHCTCLRVSSIVGHFVHKLIPFNAYV